MWDNEWRIAQERCTTLRREAAARLLLKQAREQQARRPSLGSRILDQLGRWLIAWGWRLRVRYGVLERAER
ncbi:MAG: hypothetical protein MI924_14490 [Chloroflexales bacterium]|nr:hypothetical protein [Chloroflexales bacterium]